MKKLKTITAIFMVAVMSLIFLAEPSEVQADSGENVCETIYNRCVLQALAADQSLLSTIMALENCEIMLAACQVFMTIRWR
ncbi:MAG: hypothetical protein ACUVRL_07565 [Candidatus Saccharicenans sp.]|uniref:hypothetical protein n=1 Tax=Candidatus Saccharicenans sp. TaxID=2819258 RepID=UPI0040491B8D